MKEYAIKSERIKKLREDALNSKPSVCIERAKLITESYQANEDKSIYLKRAYALEHILDNISVYINEGELIVGKQASDIRCAPIFPEYSVEWIVDELNEKGNFDKRDGDNFYLDPSKKDELLELCKYWQGKTLKDKCLAQMPAELKRASKAKVIHGEGNMTSGDGHIVPDFKKILAIGLDGVNQEIEVELKNVDITEYGGYNQVDLLQAMLVTNNAVIRFAKRYAKCASDLAQTEENIKRKLELEMIAQNCSKAIEFGATNFWEAVQVTWLTHLVIQIESNGHSASLGRVDQYLYQYYKKDVLENKVISRSFAKEILQNLWVNLYTILKIRPTSHAGYGAGYPTYQNVTISGSTHEKIDQTNELSYLILESVGENKLTQPNLSVRFNQNSPEKLINEAAEVVGLGYGMPAMHTDEIITEALIKKGVSIEDAFDYTMVGCVEVAVAGKWGYRCTGMTFINLIKTLEMTLLGGYDPNTDTQLYSGNGKLQDFRTFDELKLAYDDQVKHYTKLTVAMDTLCDTHLEEFPDIFMSSLVDNCIKRRKTVKEGGAKYDIVSGLQVGLANATNSLYAVKKLVFDEKKYRADEIMEALADNFQTVNNKIIQQNMLKVDKYGNDLEEVDQLAIDTYRPYFEEITKYHNTRFGRGPINGGYGISTSGISSNVPMGVVTGATPDGRNANTPAAEGASPTQGTDVNGPSAVINSIIKLPTDLMSGGQLLNQKYSSTIAEDEMQFAKFKAVIASFIAKKAWHIQFNVVSRETLLAAQKDPENYRDIIVRVAGYCAQFVTLDPTTQNDIIACTEQNL